MKNELLEKEEMKIENMIYEIRGKKVMLDSDVAMLFGYETFNLNKAVKRNIEKFDLDYMFIITDLEYKGLIFQNGISNNCRGGRRTLPYVFTQKGILMLATILKSKIAIEMSVKIIDAFVLMKKYISSNLLEQRYFNNLTIKNSEDIKLLTELFDKLSSKELKNEIYFEGQIYDAYSKIIDIMSKAKKNITIIDNYADKSVLDMISRMKVKVKLITKEKGLLSKQDIDKYNKQYSNLEVIYDNTFHDRYIILDEITVYHLGSSINHIGSKTFSINKIEELEFIELLLRKINK